MKTDIPDIGKNIRFLRRARNWTLIDLARKIRIREGPLGRIELGKNAPSAQVIYSLSRALNVSTEVLFAKDVHQIELKTKDTDTSSNFIAIHPEPDKIPKQLLAATHDIVAGFHALEDICSVPKHACLPLSVPFKPDYRGMENLASSIRQYFGIYDGVVFDYFELFENFGLRVIIFQFPRDSRDMASFSIYEPVYHNAFFFLNSKNNPEKQLFSLSFELGALLISNQSRLQKTDLFENPDNTKESENLRPINPSRAAGRFAATFLMPETAVRASVSQLGITPDDWSWDLLLRIKHRFGVSAQTFLYRLHELDLISFKLKDQLDAGIKEFYESTGFQEPDSTRRCLTPNGRFFDLLLTAENTKEAKKELIQIQDIEKKYKIDRK
ncbi:XRE family transcriptional regulator [Desulfobacula sp.]|uniref:helix-turn-helix domain-containing protein n=1 Tax=Desulfobacula sp. TaxID=2593537 RepID=UPI0025BB5A4D|nr:XRE family transcriptional regulator [Desulfobacula sp.]MBC2705188.1 ImmA/IrrE family metallo-endopeptidase [Desulfobacula sp.]